MKCIYLMKNNEHFYHISKYVSRLIAFFFENYIFWNTIADSFDGLRLISEILQFVYSKYT